jgi:nucleoside-diphosphate-sugar epimerase
LKILITGGTGFVGRYLVRELTSKGDVCRLLVCQSSSTEELKELGSIEFWLGDITQPETLTGISEGIDYVYHLAAEGHVSAASGEAFKKFVSVNVNGTKNIIKECGKQNIKRFIHFSSTAAMGLIKKNLVSESNPPQPVTPYQKSKLTSETVALGLGKRLGVPIVVVRPCMIYGVNGKGEFFKMSQMMQKGFFPRVGFGRNLTPLVHVKDVVRGAIKCAEKGIPGEVYLITSEHSIDLSELRNFVMEGWGAKALYPYVPVWCMYFVAWCFEIVARLTGKEPMVTCRNIASTVWDREFSIEKAKRDLGYSPQISFREGILEAVEWFRTLRMS